MKSLALFLASALAITAELLATSEPEQQHIFSAKLEPGEVLLVRTTRWIASTITLEIEWAISGEGRAEHAISWRQEHDDEVWVIAEPTMEQYVAGGALTRIELQPNELVLEIESVNGVSERRQRFEWRVTFARWSEVSESFTGESLKLPAGEFRAMRVVRRANVAASP